MTQPSELLLPRRLVEELAEERAREIVTQRHGEAAPMVPTYAAAPFAGTGLGNASEKQALLEETKGWAAIAARPKADRLQTLEPLIFQTVRAPDGGTDLIPQPQHPAKLLLDDPGPIFTKRIMMRLLSYHLDQTGEGYWQILRDGLGIPRELWPLPTHRTEPVTDPVHVISGYRVTGDRSQVVLPASDVIRFWMPDPEKMLVGMGNLAPQAVEWDADQFRLQSIRQHFQDGATPRTALKATAESSLPNRDQKEAFWTDWKQNYHNRLGRNKAVPAFLPPGFDVVNLDQFGGIAQTLDWGSSVGEKILAAYGVPGSMVGMVVDVNRAAAETNAYVFDRNTMLPLVELIAEALTMQWVRPTYGDEFTVAFKPFVAPDKEFARVQEAQDLALKVLTINEVRRGRDGLEPAEWGDDPVGSVADEPYRPDDNFGEEDAADLGRGQPVPRQIPPAPEPEPRAVDPYSRATQEAREVWDFNIRQEQRFVGKLQRALAAVWELQRRAAIEKLRALMGGGESARGGGQRVTAEDLLDPESLEWRTLYAERVTPITAAIAAEAGRVAYESMVPGGVFHLSDVIRDLFEQQATLWQFAVDRTTQRRISRILSQGAAGGESVETIAANLDVMFRNRKRARTVARTEVGKANQSGQLLGYQSSGRAAGKRWNTSLDARVRDSHRIEGQEVGLQESFELANGVMALHPLDPNLPPEDLINCLLPGTLVEGNVRGALHAWYSGKVVELETSRGHRLTVTAHHSVATSKGFVPAHLLEEGDELLSYSTEMDAVGLLVEQNPDHGPAPIEQVFSAFAMSGQVVGLRVAVAPADLHGDAVSTDGQVEIVGTDRFLRDAIEAFGAQGRLNLPLESSAGGHVHGRGLPLAGIESGGSDLLPLQQLGLPPSSGPVASVPQDAIDTRPRDAETLVERVDGRSGEVGLNDVGRGVLRALAGPADTVRFGEASGLDVSPREYKAHGASADPQFSRDLFDASAGLVVPDRLLRVRHLDYSGHVYDLHTVRGWMVANSIVTKQCRCFMTVVKRPEIAD